MKLWILAVSISTLFADTVTVVPGPVNGVILQRGTHRLAIYGDPREKPADVEKVLFTHGRRDVIWAGRGLVEIGAEAVAPAAEAEFFTGVAKFWDDYQKARFHDYMQQTSRVAGVPLTVGRSVRGGDHIEWQGITIRVIDTPGYTRGAVSYLFEADGKRYACVGDLIYGEGHLLDLYSLQDAIPDLKDRGYHGWASRAAALVPSLRKVADWEPDVVIPARGPLIRNPPAAIGKLIERLQAVYRNHFSVDALRWYRGDESIRTRVERVLGTRDFPWMANAETMRPKPPEWIMPIGNSRLVLSESGKGFLVDGGFSKVPDELEKLVQAGRLKSLDGIYVTHYHDDHTDHVQELADQFHCPVYTVREMEDVLRHPGSYRVPCLTTNPIHSLKVMPEGSSMRWNEFELTFSYFPGQTLYHAGLLMKKDGGERIMFVGDSFTPTGMDEYCLLNRNFQEPEKGFAYCLKMLRKMPQDYLLINEHVLPTFRFSPQQIDTMLDALEKRQPLLRDLFPWDDVNYGLDDQWARIYPYGTDARTGQTISLKAVVLNHSPQRREFRVTPRVPAGWRTNAGTLKISVGPREERSAPFTVTLSGSAAGIGIVTADVAFDQWDLRAWTEAMVTVGRN